MYETGCPSIAYMNVFQVQQLQIVGKATLAEYKYMSRVRHDAKKKARGIKKSQILGSSKKKHLKEMKE